MGRSGETGPAGRFRMEVPMAAFVKRMPWGRIVYVREYLRCRYGKWEQVRSHLRKWPE
jgi:hypothetical protein